MIPFPELFLGVHDLLLVGIPWLLADPLEPHARVRADLDAGGLRRGHRQLDRVHQVLGVANQHLGCFLVFFSA